MLAIMKCSPYSLVLILVGSSCLAQDTSIDERLAQLNAHVVRDTTRPDSPITEVRLTGTNANDHDMMSLSALPHLRSVDISHTAISADGLKLLLRNPALRELFAADQNLHDRDLPLFAGSSLQRLHLGINPGITGHGFRDLTLNGLVALNLAGCSIQACSLQFLPLACPNLRTLEIEYTDIPALALQDVARLPCLEELDIPGSSIDDSHLAALVGAKGLKVLILYDTDVTDSGLRLLAGASELRTLWVSDTAVTGEAVSCFPRLESLIIGGPKVTVAFDRIASAAPPERTADRRLSDHD